MLDIKFIREHPDEVKKGIAKKGVRFDVDRLLAVDEKRRMKTKEVEDLRARQNAATDEIAKAAGEGREEKISEMQSLKAKLGDLEFELKTIEEEFRNLMHQAPNLPHESVPEGDENSSVVLREVGEKPVFDFAPRDYLALAEPLGLIDTERAAKVSGSRFGYLKGAAARMEFALWGLALDFLTDERTVARAIARAGLNLAPRAFIPVIPPVLVRSEAMQAMGYVERGGEEIYHLERDDLYLVGTSEQSIGPMHMGETFAEEDLPRRYLGFSTCFRREAGSYGKDTRGILRVHQFDKTEMFSFVLPETSWDEHKLFLALEEELFGMLEIPYRVLHIAAGDLGDPAAAKYDLEAWLPGQNGGKGEYREITSTSNTTDFQARRLNVRVRRNAGAGEFVHTVNGTAFSMNRPVIAILENFQNEDGSVRVPKALRPYMHGITEIRRIGQ